MGDSGSKTVVGMRLLFAAVIVFCFFGAAAWAAAQTPKFSTLYLRGAQDCLPQSPSAGGAGVRVFSDLLSFRVQAMDDKTASDLFGRQFNRRFFAYQICLTSGGQPTAPPPAVYLLQDFLQIPVTISEASGASLAPDALRQLSLHPEFKNSGLSDAASSVPSSEGLCLTANAFYTPASAEQIIEGKSFDLPGGFQLVRTKRLRLDAFQRRNVLAHVIRPLEKIPPRQHIERVLTLPQEVSVGGRAYRLFPCFDYLRAGILISTAD